MSRNIKKNNAMTLVETLFCAVIFTFIMGACVALLLRGWDSWNISSAQAELTQELNQSAFWLTNDLRQSGASVITNVPADDNPYTQISFAEAQDVLSGSVVWGPVINYSLGGTNGQQLIRVQNAQTHIIAVHVTTFQISRQAASPNMVNVQLTAHAPTLRGNQQLTATLNFKVLLRNT